LALEDFLSQFPSPQPTPESQAEARFLFPWEIEAGQPEPPPSAMPPLPPAQDEPFRSIEANLNPRSVMENPTQPVTILHIDETQPGSPLSLEDTQPVKVGSACRPTDQDISNPVLTNLVYTCILLPRLPEHTLSGDLAHYLAEWMPQLCLAFGWQIEGLVIQRQYLQWSVQVLPAISSGNVVRIIRQQTSQLIINTYPRYQAQNPQDDFWAPGFLIISGSEPPSPFTVVDFIQQTRQRQGISGLNTHYN